MAGLADIRDKPRRGWSRRPAAPAPRLRRLAARSHQRLQNIIQRASATGDIQVLGQTKIISDERTNSLLIYASKEDMKTIKEIVAKLDVVLAQVLIEAVILEVTLNDSLDLGFSYLQHPQKSGNWTGVGAINNKNFLKPNDYSGLNGVTNASGILPSGLQLSDVLWPGPRCDGDGAGGRQPRQDPPAPADPNLAQ